MPKWLNSLSLAVAGVLLSTMLVGSLSFNNEVKANTMQNQIDARYNLKTDQMLLTLARIDENVKFLKEQRNTHK